MARLPDFSAFGDRPSPRPQRDLGGYRAGVAEGAAIQAGESLARTGQQITQLGQDIGESQDRLNYARARSAFLRAKTELDSAFESDQDYATWEKRYGQALSKVRDTIAGGLTGARYRTEFEAETGLDYERGLAVIREKTRARVRDAGRADLLTTLSQNREAALNSPDAATREALIGATNDAITSAVGSGMLTAVEGVEQREAWAKTYQADREARFAQTFTADLDRWRNAVLSDPGQIGTAEAELAAQIAASGLPEADKLKYAAELKNGLAVSALTSSILSNPGAAKSQLLGGRWDAYLGADKKATLLGAADVAIRQREAEFRQRQAEEQRRYLSGYEDTVAFLRDGGVLPDNQYSRSRLTAVMGAEEGGKLADEVEGAVAFGQAVSAVKWATPEEIQALVTAEGADLAGATGYKTQRAELAAITAAVAERNRALLDDPAAFVAQAPNVKTAYEAMTLALADETGATDSQAAVAAFANASLAEQERLGLAPEQQRLLPQAYVDSVVSRFTFQPEGGENAAAIVQGLAEQWGRYWPQVQGELDSELTAGAAVIASMPPGPAAIKLAEANNVGEKVLAETLDSEGVKTMRAAVPGALEEFHATMIGSDAKYLQYQQQTELLALKYMTEGRSPAEAARLAAMDTVAARYTFVDTYRIPVEQDPVAIERGAEYVISTFGGDPAAEVDLPISLMGLNPEQTRAAYLSALRRDGYWVTAPDESGLVLYDATGSAVTRGGRPVAMTWAELAAPPRATAPTPVPFGQEIMEQDGAPIGGGAGSGELGGGAGDDTLQVFPVNIRQYVSHLIGTDRPITEEAFVPADLDAMKRAVLRDAAKSGKTSGEIGYGDFGEAPGQFSRFPFVGAAGMLRDSFADPKMRLETTIGMARWRKDEDGNVIVEDEYNFNASREKVNEALKDRNTVELIVDAYGRMGFSGIVNVLGNIFGKTDDEKGTPVRINLGKVKGV